jgi:uncharacterized membrane protein (DUF441 family)
MLVMPLRSRGMHKGVVTLTAAKRINADLVAGQAQAAMLAADFYSAMALRWYR